MAEANKAKILEDEIVMQTYGVLAEITDTLFFEAIGGLSFEEVIKKIEKSKEKSIQYYENITKSAMSKIALN